MPSDVMNLLRAAAGRDDVISFAGGLPAPRTFPRALLRDAACHAVEDGRHDALQYDWPEGRPALRERVAERLRARGVDVDPGEIVMTNGAQEAIALTTEVLQPPAIQVDEATYSSALELFRGRGARPVVERAPVRYLMPAVGNPRGWSMSEAERDDALEAEHLVEDDAYADLLFAGPAPTPLLARARDRVWYVGSVSKTLSPGLRVGWLVPPPAFHEKVIEAKARADLQAGGLAQSIVEQFLSRVDFERRVTRLRGLYAARARRLCDAVERVLGLPVRRPEGGFSLWVETDVHVSDVEALRAGLEAGVVFEPGGLFWADPERSRPLWMRLSYSSGSPRAFGEGMERLGRVLERLRAQAATRGGTSS